MILKAKAANGSSSEACLSISLSFSSVPLIDGISVGAGFKNTTTGDTICDEKNFVILEKMEFPEPVIELAIEPKTKQDQDKLGTGLSKLAYIL